MRTVLTAARLLTPDKVVDRPVVAIEESRIAGIRSRGATEETSAAAQYLDFPEATLVPAYLDIHIHGAAGHDVMEGTPAALDAIAKFLAAHGVAAYLPTTVTAPVDATLRALEDLARAIEQEEKRGADSGRMVGARPVGIHLEGPFLSHGKRGVHPPTYLEKPSVELLRRFWEAASGRILVMTVAPELPGAPELIEHATSLGIRVSLGHSNANTREARAGIAAGAKSATHTFNAMRPLDHREPGLLGVVLDDANLFAELICDGIHTDPLLARLFLKAKGLDRGILITDAISATGMPDGVYQLGGGLEVTVANGRCLHDGKLAGSVLTLDRAVRNFAVFTETPYSVAARYASANPARLIGMEDTYGELAPGRPANITVLSPAGEVVTTLLNGQVLGS